MDLSSSQRDGTAFVGNIVNVDLEGNVHMLIAVGVQQMCRTTALQRG